MLILAPGVPGCGFLKGHMGRNRKYQSAAIRFAPAIKALFLFILIGVSGVGYVWQKDVIYSLAQQKKSHEQRLEQWRIQNKLLRDQLNFLSLPRVLESRVKELNLGLGPPLPEQIVRLSQGAGNFLAPTPTLQAPPPSLWMAARGESSRTTNEIGIP